MDDLTALIGSSMESLTLSLRATSHNIANINTIGYKRLEGSFAAALEGEMGAEKEPSLDFSQGAITQTGRSLDLAINGKGFFVIETPDGKLYTRNGTFAINSNGQLVDTSGRTVAGASGQITIPSTVSPAGVNVSTDGQVTAGGQTVGQLELVAFDDTSVLRPVGLSCFQSAGADEPAAATEARIQQGYLEGSNVSAVEELVRLITITRLYQGNVKSMQAQSQGKDKLMQVAMGS